MENLSATDPNAWRVPFDSFLTVYGIWLIVIWRFPGQAIDL